MTDITVHIQPVDGPVFDYSLDPKTTIAELREILVGDEMIEGDELIMITDTRARIPKIQEDKKTFESISNGDKVVKLTLYKKNQPEQRPEETKLEASGKLSLSSPGKEESGKSLNREPSLTGYVDVMELTDDEIKNILNKCSYLYGRKVESDLRVTEAAKKFFADIPENRQFEQSNRSSQNHLGEKFIRISRKEEQEALVKGYSEGNVKLSVKLVADVQGKLHKDSTKQTARSKKGEYIYMESAYHSATFKLREIRSVVSDDVKNFFKPGEAMSTEKMYEFLNTFGALVPESITVGGKRYTTIEAKSIQSNNSTIDIDDKSIQADLTIKMFGIGGSGAGGNHTEKKASNFSRQDSFTMQCFGGNPEFKDQPDEWIRSVCRNWSTWQIVSIHDFRYTYEYLDEPFRTWFKRIFEPNSIEHLQYQDGSFYAGQTISGKKEGKGKLTYANGDVYEGQFRDDKEDGPGKLTKKTGRVCEATWKNGVVNNWMRMTMPNRVIYEGPMENFEPEGKGTWTYPNGDVLIIPLKNSKEDGVVTKKCEDGRVIEVVFENGVVVKGKSTSSGDVYEGDIVDFQANGHGILKWNSGNIYEGQFIDDYMHGSGKLTYHNGGSYEGEWKHGRKHGTGTFIASQGRPWRGLLRYDGGWVAGEMCGQGTAIECNGYSYTGSFRDNYFHGVGEFQILPKTVINHPLTMIRYEGDFFKGNKEGFGRLNYANGFIYDGEFKQDQPDGKGSLFWKGKWEKGTWDSEKIRKKLNSK